MYSYTTYHRVRDMVPTSDDMFDAQVSLVDTCSGDNCK